jgi:hypothetical protein
VEKHPLRVAFEARDLAAMVDTLAPDVVFSLARDQLPL